MLIIDGIQLCVFIGKTCNMWLPSLSSPLFPSLPLSFPLSLLFPSSPILLVIRIRQVSPCEKTYRDYEREKKKGRESEREKRKRDRWTDGWGEKMIQETVICMLYTYTYIYVMNVCKYIYVYSVDGKVFWGLKRGVEKNIHMHQPDHRSFFFCSLPSFSFFLFHCLLSLFSQDSDHW